MVKRAKRHWQIKRGPIATRIAPIRPIAIYAYVDRITVWLRQPLTRRQRAALAPSGSIRIANEPAPFPGGFQQRLQISQPNTQTLRALACISHHLNYVEISLDWIFRNEMERDDAADFLDHHAVKRWHRGEVRYHKGTRYTDRRGAPNNLVEYHDLPSRVTGETNCLHLDWRIRGRAACRRAGITSAADLLSFDHRRFWQERLVLATLDLRKLGRLHRKHWRPGSAPTWLCITRGGLPYDKDLHIGAILFNLEDRSTQKVLDQFGRMFRVRDCLIRLEVKYLVPASTLL